MTFLTTQEGTHTNSYDMATKRNIRGTEGMHACLKPPLQHSIISASASGSDKDETRQGIYRVDADIVEQLKPDHLK